MKKVFAISFLFLVLSGFGARQEAMAQRFEYNNFYVSLAPHGSWIEIDNGLLAWRPSHIHNRWAPYQAGRWVWSSYGWYWDSYEPFGDITYHYGRWYNDDYYGWLWIPDNEWGPAWVEWRYDDDYIGWAPLSPYATFSISIGAIRFTHAYTSPWGIWNFVRYRHFCEHNLNTYYIPSSFKHKVFSDTKYRNDYGYDKGRVINRGIDRNFIERRGNVRIQEREIVRVNNPRTDVTRTRDRVEVYAPGRDVLTRGDVNNIKIERTERKSSLEISRVDIGRREDRNVSRDNTNRTREESVRKIEVKREEPPVRREERTTEIKREVIRTAPETRNAEIQQKRDEERKRIEEKKAVVRENRNEEKREAVKEQRQREERQNQVNERRQEVRENRSDRGRQQESRNTENRQREDKEDSKDRRTR